MNSNQKNWFPRCCSPSTMRQRDPDETDHISAYPAIKSTLLPLVVNIRELQEMMILHLKPSKVLYAVGNRLYLKLKLLVLWSFTCAYFLIQSPPSDISLTHTWNHKTYLRTLKLYVCQTTRLQRWCNHNYIHIGICSQTNLILKHIWHKTKAQLGGHIWEAFFPNCLCSIFNISPAAGKPSFWEAPRCCKNRCYKQSSCNPKWGLNILQTRNQT